MDTKYLLMKIKEPYYDKYGGKLPENWLADEDEIVDKIINEWSPEKCIGILTLCSEALEYIFGKNPLFSEIPDTELGFKQSARIPEQLPKQLLWSWRHLLDIADNRNWSLLDTHNKDFSNSIIVLGYVLIYYLATAKIYLYLGKHEHNLDTLYIKYANILEQDRDPFIANFPQKSLDRTIHFIENIRKKDDIINNIRRKDDKHSENIELYLWEAIDKVFPADLQESIDKCIKGEVNINFIPRAVAMDTKDESKKKSNLKDKLTDSLDGAVTDTSVETFKELLEDDNEISPEKLIQLRNFKSEINKLLSNDIKLLTDRQKQAISLIFIQDLSIVDAAKELGINEATLRKNHLPAALKKIRRHLAAYNK